MQGIIAISGSDSSSGTTRFAGVRLDNGSYIVTSADSVYVAPWYAVTSAGENRAGGLQMSQDSFYVAGDAWNFVARIIFECESDTITGTAWRSSADTEVQILLPPRNFDFEPGQTEIAFSIKYRPVNEEEVPLDTPAWAAALLRRV